MRSLRCVSVGVLCMVPSAGEYLHLAPPWLLSTPARCQVLCAYALLPCCAVPCCAVLLQAIVGGGLALGWGGVNWLLAQQSSNKGTSHCWQMFLMAVGCGKCSSRDVATAACALSHLHLPCHVPTMLCWTDCGWGVCFAWMYCAGTDSIFRSSSASNGLNRRVLLIQHCVAMLCCAVLLRCTGKAS